MQKVRYYRLRMSLRMLCGTGHFVVMCMVTMVMVLCINLYITS